MDVKMKGNLNDEGNEKQRAVYLLKAIRAFVGQMLIDNPDAEALDKIEWQLREGTRWTRRFKVHSANETLLAAAVTMAAYVKGPESIEWREGESVISRQVAKRLANLLAGAAWADDEEATGG